MQDAPLDAAGVAALGMPIGSHDTGDMAEIEMPLAMIGELFSGLSSPEAIAFAALCDTLANDHAGLVPPEILDVSPAVRDARRRVRSFAFLRAVTTRLDKEAVVRNRRTFLGKPDRQLVA